MPRDLPVGNGRFLICFDQNYWIRDLYFPHIGQENHVGRHFFRLGVWVENGMTLLGRSRTEDWVDNLFSEACDSIHGGCRVK